MQDYPNLWDKLIDQMEYPHFLQSAEWASVKSAYNWTPIPLVWISEGDTYKMKKFTGSNDGARGSPCAAAMILERTIPILGRNLNARILYVPKGPMLMDWGNSKLLSAVLVDLAEFSHYSGALFIKIDPDFTIGSGEPGETFAITNPQTDTIVRSFQDHKWRYSEEQIQFKNTVSIDLCQTEDELLSLMKQKTRYNIRLAQRKGVTIRAADPGDYDSLYCLYAETSLRDGFAIREKKYYITLWETFLDNQMGEALIAEVDGTPVAAAVILRFTKIAWYFQGMSTLHHRDRMPNYLLQWEAMKRAKKTGCQVYDMWGAPDVFTETDPLWNVYRFKKGFGGEVVRHIGAWDYIARPVSFWIYRHSLPLGLAGLRRIGRKSTRQSIS